MAKQEKRSKKSSDLKSAKIVVHNGSFHTDDVFAVATLFLALGENFDLKVVRTRDENLIKSGDYVVDVGGVYDEASERFDHHQEGGAGKRANGIPYASFGLVWKKYGEKVCGSEAIAEIIDQKLATPIDAEDNGEYITKAVYKNVTPYQIQDFLTVFNPTWKESGSDVDVIFMNEVLVVKTILCREIQVSSHKLEAEHKVEEIYENSPDKRLIILDNYFPFRDVLKKFSEPLFVVHPEYGSNNWAVRTVRVEDNNFASRKDLPSAWAGKRDEAIQKITGVSDATFCHNKRFVVVAKSKEGAIKLAQLALRS